LEAAIRELTVQMRKEYGLPITFQDDKSLKPVSDDVRYFLFRAIRELLVNVTKHARASQARISLRRENRNLVIGVADNGVGWEHTEMSARLSGRGGFGLFNIRERLAQLGGSLTIQSEPGEGTLITMVIPLQEGASEEEAR
ncbi:MAG: sensor histidine kinase, partial [bacterium]